MFQSRSRLLRLQLTKGQLRLGTTAVWTIGSELCLYCCLGDGLLVDVDGVCGGGVALLLARIILHHTAHQVGLA